MQKSRGPSGRLLFVGGPEQLFLDTDTLIGMI